MKQALVVPIAAVEALIDLKITALNDSIEKAENSADSYKDIRKRIEPLEQRRGAYKTLREHLKFIKPYTHDELSRIVSEEAPKAPTVAMITNEAGGVVKVEE